MSDKGTYSYSNRHRMHEVSDTPRTDEQVIQFGDGPAKYVYAAFADQLEREIRQLEVAIYDLKTENNELRKDKERLDWLLNYEGNYWLLQNRNDIDKKREESQ